MTAFKHRDDFIKAVGPGKFKIGFAGFATCGKTSVAQALQVRLGKLGLESQILSFATPLKDLCRKEFFWDGRKDEKGRHLLQEIGCAARHYRASIWLDKWLAAADASPADVVMCDDVRFPNEITTVRGTGGIIIRLNAPWAVSDGHESEKLPPDGDIYDIVVDTDGKGTVEIVAEEVWQQLGRILSARK
jgi:hypothetical protein